MKTIEDLERFYHTQLVADLNPLEAHRKKVLQKVIFTIVGAAVLVFLTYLLKLHHFFYFLIFIAWAFGYYYLTSGYVSDFKDKIIRKLIEFVDSGLKYDKEGFVPKNSFLESNIFRTRPNIYNGDDLVCGKVGSTNIEFSEINAQYETGSGKNRHVETVFKGLFFIADFNKRFNGRTVVLPDMAEKMLGHLGTMLQSWNVARDKLVKLEDPEFEKRFAVYSTDQIESRYILSTSLMRRITDFVKKSRKKVWLSFINNKIFVAVWYSRDLFEPRVFRTLLDYKQVKEYFEDLHLAISIVDELNLNTRIWGK